MSAAIRPTACRCAASCNHERHAVLRRFLNAVHELREASAAVLSRRDSDGHQEECDRWGILTDVQGIQWALEICESGVEGATLPCCHSDAKWAEVMERRETRRGATRRASLAS